MPAPVGPGRRAAGWESVRCRAVSRLTACAARAAAVVVLVGGLGGCGPDHDAALAIVHARRRSPTTVELRTECADHLRLDVRRRPGHKPEVTIWGRPRVGRCQPLLRVRLRSDQLVDGATSMAVDVT